MHVAICLPAHFWLEAWVVDGFDTESTLLPMLGGYECREGGEGASELDQARSGHVLILVKAHIT